MKRRILSLAMSIIFVILTLPTAILPVEAAYPAIARSNPIKAYLTPTDNNTIAYDPNSRSKSIGKIWSTDEVWIYEISDNGIVGSYPLDKGGRRDFYLPLSYLTNGKSLGHINGTATKQITTYRRAGTSNTYGYVAAGDAVVKIDERNGFVQLLYPIQGGYKCGYAKSADYNAHVKQVSSATVTWDTKPVPNIPKTTASVPNVNGFKLADIPNGEVIIYYKDTFYCVDAQFGSKENGTKLILQLPNNGLNQKWFLQKTMMNDGTGRWFYTIESMNARGKIVEVRNNGTHNGAEIALWSNAGIQCQAWFIVENSGFYSLINVNSLSFMDADNADVSNYNGQNIHQWQNAGGNTGKFRFQYVSGSVPTPVPAPDKGTSYEQARVKTTRADLVAKARTLVDRVPYFWGGKYPNIGENPQWKNKKTVTASGSRTTGKSIHFGLDCSGFVEWVYIQFGWKGFAGKNSKGQIDSITSIKKSDLKPGDIGYTPGHIGIYAGDGYWIHANGGNPATLSDGTYCVGGKVKYDKYSGFTQFGRVGSFIGD